ncbi:hypothetical protein GA845_00245 [Burkholderia pseudomallei]|nr:hypothetical protein [Burkholderia pseudomallei]
MDEVRRTRAGRHTFMHETGRIECSTSRLYPRAQRMKNE